MSIRRVCTGGIVYGILCFLIALADPLFSAARFQEDEKLRIAVFPFATKGVGVEDAGKIRDQWATVLDQSGKVRVMSWSAMQAVMQDVGFSKLDECQTSACAAYFGKILGVDAVVLGSVERVDESYRLQARLVKVSTSDVLYDRTRALKDHLEALLANHIGTMAQEMTNTQFESHDKYRWYIVGGAIAGVGVLVYLVGKSFGLFGGSDRHYEGTTEKPGPDDGR